MSKRFNSQAEIDAFLAEPRLAILMYHGNKPSPVGVPVWFEWDGEAVRMFAARNSQKVQKLKANPSVSILVTNRVGEPEGWVAFDGDITLSDFSKDEWEALIESVAPRYWDLSNTDYAATIQDWKAAPEAMISLTLVPTMIRSGA